MNISKTKLTEKRCTACIGSVTALSYEVQSDLLTELGDGWIINESWHLSKEYKFKNFTQAMKFANQIALLAEDERHHPNLTITWGKCSVEIWTHKINALSENDFILASKIKLLQID